MVHLKEQLNTPTPVDPLPPDQAAALSAELGRLADMAVYVRSLVIREGMIYFLGKRGGARYLGIIRVGGPLPGFIGAESTVSVDGMAASLQVCPANAANAQALRAQLPFLAPQAVGLRKSVGCGDRLGIATPGHVRAVRRGTMYPIFAQQSIREMTRTGRTPQQVLDDATWGVFQEGWRDGYSADADHLKTIEDIEQCVSAGFVLYTFDPGEYVDDQAATQDADTLRTKVEQLPWHEMDISWPDLRCHYLGRTMDAGDFAITFDELTLLHAVAKYARAVIHTTQLYRYLVGRLGGTGRTYELEVSVDETTTPTSPAEHYFVANELKRLGVQMVSLAPRFVGRFEKGVDYIGDVAAFEQQLRVHVAIARALGPYKISFHSGSDKFALYPIAARVAGDLVHLKTAGTSYLEALRVVARVHPSLFREILAFALERYATDRQSYHVSADLSRVSAAIRSMDDQALSSFLDTFDGRQVLHVTFGSVLTARDGGQGEAYRFRDRLLAALQEHEEMYYQVLEEHFARHILPFS
ncbi:MAG: tagaturonate epimerase family protein [Anaerolineae bacterium]